MMKSHHLHKCKNIKFPGFVSIKYDGVPCGISNKSVISRQGVELPSLKWIQEQIGPYIPDGWTIWAEVCEDGQPFNYVSGKVRARNPYKECWLYAFNLDTGNDDHHFGDRYLMLESLLESIPLEGSQIMTIPQSLVLSERDLACYTDLDELDIEGYMYHPVMGKYTHNRSWDSLKIVKTINYDLKFVSCVPAIDKDGNEMDIAGSLLFKDGNDTHFIVGPGKLTHEQRKLLLDNQEYYAGNGWIGCIRTKNSTDTYDKLREPTFQYWREDKREPDIVNDKQIPE